MKSVNYEGIENLDIMRQTSCQLEDWEIEKFLKLRRDLAITLNPETRKKIRYEMAVMLGKVEEEKTLAVEQEEEKEQEVISKPDTIAKIKDEYEEIKRELDEGSRDPKLHERYLGLKQEAEKLNNISGEQEEEKDGADSTEVVSSLSFEEEMETDLGQSMQVELLPEEVEMLLGEEPQREETVEVEKRELGAKVKGWFKGAKDKLTDWKEAFVERKKGEPMSFATIPEEEEHEDDFLPSWPSETFDEYGMEEDCLIDNKQIEQEDREERENQEQEGVSAQVGEERLESVKQDPFQVLTDEAKKEMEMIIAKMIEEKVNERLQKVVITSEKATEPVQEVAKPVETKRPVVSDAERARARMELKRKIKAMAKENKIFEYEGYEIEDFPSKLIVAELQLTGKLERTGKTERSGIIYTKSDEILHVDEEGNITVGKYSQASQNPCEVSRKGQSQIGLGMRGRAGMEMDL